MKVIELLNRVVSNIGRRCKWWDFIILLTALGGMGWVWGPFLSKRFALSPWFDTIYLTGPLFCEISRDVALGKTALLNWTTLEALDYNTHIATYYPFYLLRWLDFCSPAAAAQASDIVGVLHLFIMLAFTFALGHLVGLGVAPAAAGALLATTSLNSYMLAAWPTIGAAAAWLPLAVVGLVLILYKQRLALGSSLLALGTGAMLTAGPGTNILAALTFIALVLVLHADLPLVLTGRWRDLLTQMCALAAAGAAIVIVSL